MESLFYPLLWLLSAITPGIAITLLFITAPYGRFSRAGWGPLIPASIGWVAMETPAVVTILLMYLLGERITNICAIIFLATWQFHYLYRSFIFPFKHKGKNKPMPLSVVAMAMLFNVWNGFLNGAWLFFLGPERQVDWLYSVPFIAGMIIFFTGVFINRQSDHILMELRSPGEAGYKIPRGGLYRFVSMPSYFGELLEWCGFALLTWSPAALVFALFTAANLIPRALSNHRWYRKEFPGYPAERKAVIPFII